MKILSDFDVVNMPFLPKMSFKSSSRWRLAKVLLCAIGLMFTSSFLWACNGPGKDVETSTIEHMPPSDTLTYAEIASQQNMRVSRVEKLWSPLKSDFNWVEDGKGHHEKGEGHLILVPPNKVALTFSKIGEIGFWAGSNDDLFWVFEGAGDTTRMSVARNSNLLEECCEALPVAVHPLELIDLYGLFAFPELPNVPVTFDSQFNAWVLNLPGRWNRRRVYLDVKTLLPIQVELMSLTSGDEIIATAHLSDYDVLDRLGLEDSLRPRIPKKIRIVQQGFDGQIEIEILRPRDRTPRGAIRPAVFDFEAVRRSMKPDEVHILDHACLDPAVIKEQ